MGARGLVRTVVVAAAAVALSAAPLRADDGKPELTVDDRDYDQIDLVLDLALDLDQGTVAGTATHSLASLRDGLAAVRMHCEDVKVESATADGAACAVAQDEKVLTVTLDRPRKKDEPLKLVLKYAGKPK